MSCQGVGPKKTLHNMSGWGVIWGILILAIVVLVIVILVIVILVKLTKAPVTKAPVTKAGVVWRSTAASRLWRARAAPINDA